MPTLPNMGLITPTLGGDSGVWDDKINAAFGLVDAHDHTSGKGVAVPVAGLNINADLPLGGFSISNAGKVTFSPIATPSSGSKYLFVDSGDNELYWRNNGGSNVKITSGGTLNISVVGGIVGDYSSVGAEVAYDDANDTYTFKQQGSPKPWARIETGPVRIYEYNTTETVYVEQAVAAALAASYTVTWPAALPGGQVAMQITAAGLLVYSNTFTSAITATDYKISATRTKLIPASAADPGATGVRIGTNGVRAWEINGSILSFPVTLDAGDRITGYIVLLHKDSNNTVTVNARLYTYELKPSNAGSETAQGAGATDNENAPGDTTQLTETGLAITMSGVGTNYETAWVAISGGSGTDQVYGVVILYDRP